MIVVGPNLNSYNVSTEHRDRVALKVKDAKDFILAVLKKAKEPKNLDFITDAFEIKCEKDGMNRTERREKTDSFIYYRANAINDLITCNKIERVPGQAKATFRLT